VVLLLFRNCPSGVHPNPTSGGIRLERQVGGGAAPTFNVPRLGQGPSLTLTAAEVGVLPRPAAARVIAGRGGPRSARGPEPSAEHAVTH